MEFSWNNDEAIIVRKQDAIAVYGNPNGEIVIRQQDEYGDEDDIIVVNAIAARALSAALVKEADELSRKGLQIKK